MQHMACIWRVVNSASRVEGLAHSNFTPVVMSYLYQHPGQLHRSGVMLVSAAFAEEYPYSAK